MYMNDSIRLKTRLAAAVKKQQAALAKLGDLLADPSSSSALIRESQETVARLHAHQQRIMQELKLVDLERPERYGGENARSGRGSIREIVFEILDKIVMPTCPGTHSEFATLLYGISVPAGRFASLRR